MSNNRYRDFDQGRAEKQGEPVVFKIRGREITLPPSIPAIVPITALRLSKTYGKESNVPKEEIISLALQVLGDQVLDQLFEAGVTTDELGDILRWVFSVYSGVDPEEEESEGNSQAPAEPGEQTSQSELPT